MNTVKIGGREIPLFYSTYEMLDIQKEIGCTAFQLRDEVFGIRQEDEDDPMSLRFDCVTDPEKTARLGTLIRILGNALAAMAVINEGNRAEQPEQESENGPVDEGLEEEIAKKPQGK